MSKSLSKQFWLYLNVTVPSNLLRVSLLILLSVYGAFALPLDNWSSTLFRFAVDMGEVSGSPTGMFWDYIDPDTAFSSFLPHGTDHYHWSIAPVMKGGFSTSQYKDQQNFGKIQIQSQLQYGRLSVNQAVNVDTRYNNDQYYPAHQTREARGRVDEAYMQLDYSRGFLRLGRLNRNWGPFPDISMVLSDQPYSFDALEWQFYSSFFEFRHLFSAFPYKRSNWDNMWETSSGSPRNRFLSAHSLNFKAGSWVTLGLTETVIFARESGMPDVQYSNPFMLYAVTNLNQEGDANLMLALQWSIRPLTERIELKGQIALDDFQVDNSDETGNPTDDEPNHWGFATEAIVRNPVSVKWDNIVKARYVYASKYLYTVPDLNTTRGERYSFLGKSLGFSDPDMDRASLLFECRGNNFWTAKVEATYQRKGQKTLLSKWGDSQWPLEEKNKTGLPLDYLDHDFPSGIVEYTGELTLGGSAYLWGRGELNVSLINRWVKNRDNIFTGRYEYCPSLLLGLSLHYGNIHLSLPK